jgi:hypothetical protein
VRRADHGQTLHLAPVQQLARDEARLDGLADADVVGDQQSHGILAQRHQQRHQLVSPGLDPQMAEAAKRAGPGAKLQAQGVAHGEARDLGAGFAGIGRREDGRGRRAALQGQVDDGSVVVATAQGAQAQDVFARFGQHHPLAVAGADEAARLEAGL